MDEESDKILNKQIKTVVKNIKSSKLSEKNKINVTLNLSSFLIIDTLELIKNDKERKETLNKIIDYIREEAN